MNATDTLWLSRLIPDLRSRHARWLMANPRCLYAAMLECFGNTITHHSGTNPHADPRGLLFRIEDSTRQSPSFILAQSTHEPDWTVLLQRAERVLLPERPPECVEFPRNWSAGQQMRFRLRANPTKSLPGRGLSPGVRARGRIVPLHGEEEQREWLRRKLHGAASIVDVMVRDEGNRRLAPGKDKGAGAHVVSVLYEGILSVENPARLSEIQESGIGRGRAFGYGMLSLPRLRR